MLMTCAIQTAFFLASVFVFLSKIVFLQFFPECCRRGRESPFLKVILGVSDYLLALVGSSAA